jgi:hypothetical protein
MYFQPIKNYIAPGLRYVQVDRWRRRMTQPHSLKPLQPAQRAINVLLEVDLITEQAIWLRQVGDGKTKLFGSRPFCRHRLKAFESPNLSPEICKKVFFASFARSGPILQSFYLGATGF